MNNFKLNSVSVALLFALPFITPVTTPAMADTGQNIVCQINFSSGSGSLTFSPKGAPMSYSYNGQEQSDARMSGHAVSLNGGRVTWSGKPKSGATLSVVFKAKSGSAFHDDSGTANCN